MIVVTQKEGLMSNRMFHFSHLLAHSVNNDEILWYPFIDELRQYFPNLDSDLLRGYKVITTSSSFFNFLLRIISWTLPRLKLGAYYLTARSDKATDLSNVVRRGIFRIVFVKGWLLRDYEAVKKHREILMLLFKFPYETEQRLRSELRRIRPQGSIIVGVHVRRGDYINHEDGKYFYSVESYSRFIIRMTRLCLKISKHAVFVVSTNDRDAVNQLKSTHPESYIFQNDPITDLCMLSLCDYIIGPPSTFSSWASFYGEVPVLHLESPIHLFELSDFKVITG